MCSRKRRSMQLLNFILYYFFNSTLDRILLKRNASNCFARFKETELWWVNGACIVSKHSFHLRCDIKALAPLAFAGRLNVQLFHCSLLLFVKRTLRWSLTARIFLSGRFIWFVNRAGRESLLNFLSDLLKEGCAWVLLGGVFNDVQGV